MTPRNNPGASGDEFKLPQISSSTWYTKAVHPLIPTSNYKPLRKKGPKVKTAKFGDSHEAIG